ncbi:MAG: hypothetical protein WA981_03765 [Glaciecola sp.]
MATRNFTILNGTSSYYALTAGVTPAHIKLWAYSIDGSTDGLPAGAPAVEAMKSKLLEWDYTGSEITTLGFDGANHFNGAIYKVEFYDNSDTLIHSWALDGDGLTNESDSVGGNTLSLNGISASNVLSLTQETEYRWVGAENLWDQGDVTLGGTNTSFQNVAQSQVLANYSMNGRMNMRYVCSSNTFDGTIRFSSPAGNTGYIPKNFVIPFDYRAKSHADKINIQAITANITGTMSGIDIRFVLDEIDPRPAMLLVQMGDSITYQPLFDRLTAYKPLFDEFGNVEVWGEGSSGASLSGYYSSYFPDLLSRVNAVASNYTRVLFVVSMGTNPDGGGNAAFEAAMRDLNADITAAGYDFAIANKTASLTEMGSGVEDVINTNFNNPLCAELTPDFYDSDSSRPVIDMWTSTYNFGETWLYDAVHPGDAGRAQWRTYMASQISSAYFNTVPTANAGADQSVNAGQRVQLDGKGSTIGCQSYTWAQISGPAISIYNNGNANATIDAPSLDSQSTIVLGLIVTKDGVDSTQDTVTITVAPRQGGKLSAGKMVL